MGKAYEVITGRVVNPGANITAITPNQGDVLQVKQFEPPGRARLVMAWAKAATAGVLRIRSPRLHDPVQNLRFRVLAGIVRPLLDPWFPTRLVSGDNLIVELSGGAAETDVAAIMVAYDDLAGSDPNLADWNSVQPRIANMLTVEVATVAGATAGDWSAGVAINATFDNFKADAYYAILGYTTDVNLAAVAVRGPDTGNVRMGGPGTTEVLETRDYFVNLSRDLGEPCIPVFRANNKGATQVFTCDVAAATAANVTLILAELTGPA